MPALRTSREAFKKGTGDQARSSATDFEARVMKMPDGGYRPAFNVQFVTDVASGVIVDARAVNRGTDNGLMGEGVDRLVERYDRAPREMLADAGFGSLDDIDRVAREHGVTAYMPVKNEKKLREKGRDPYAPRPGDTPAVRDWRHRMGTEEGRKAYKFRGASAEWVNAGCRNRGFYQVRVRGVRKAECCALWQALAHNLVTVARGPINRRAWATPCQAG